LGDVVERPLDRAAVLVDDRFQSRDWKTNHVGKLGYSELLFGEGAFAHNAVG